MQGEHDDTPSLDDHPGLDNDEATEKGKMMTAEGSVGHVREDEDGETNPRSAS